MESILTSVKKMLGIAEDYEHFDPELIMHINSVINILNQLGVCPDEGYSISSKDDTWEDYIGSDKLIELVKTYIFLKVKLIFDPPASSAVAASYERQIAEYEWRINVMVDKREEKEDAD